MAITSTFAADFSKFQAAVDQAKVTLVSFEAGSERVKTSLDRMTDGFSGRKLIQDANLMTRAIEEAGGVSTLTANQLQQAGAKAAEAAEKMQRLGIAVPPELQKLVAAAKPVPPLFEQMTSALGPIGAAMAGAFTVGAVVSLGKQVLGTADTLTKMADRTGIGVVGLQRLNAIAEASGNTIEDVAGAVNKFQIGLAGGDLDGPLRKLGIAIEDITAQAPDQQFITIAKAIQGIKDPTDQTRASYELFGRAGATLLPSLKADVDTLANSTTTMSEESVKALDDFGDELGRLKTSGTNAIGNLVGEAAAALLALQSLAAWIKTNNPKTDDKATALPVVPPSANPTGGTNDQAGQFETWEQTLMRASASLRPFTAALKPAQLGLIDMDAATKTANADLGTLDAQLRRADAAAAYATVIEGINAKIKEGSQPTATLTTAQAALATSYKAMGLSAQEIGQKLGVSTNSVKAFQVGIDIQKASVIATDKAFHNWLVTIPDVASQSAALTNITEGLTEDGLLPASSTTDKFNKHLLTLKEIGGEAGATMGTFGKATEDAEKKLSKLDQALANIPGRMADAFTGGGGLKGAAEAIGTDVGSALGDKIGQGMTSLGKFGGPLGAAVGSLLGPVIGKVIGLFHDAEEEINPVRQGFVDLHGGLHNLNVEAHAAGVTLDAMLDARNPEEYKKAIDDLTAALDHQADIVAGAGAFGLDTDQLDAASKRADEVYNYMAASGKYSADQIAKAYEAAQVAAAAAGDEAAQAWLDAQTSTKTGVAVVNKELDALVSQRQGLIDGLAKEAPEAVSGVIETQMRGQVDALDSEITKQNQKMAAEAEALARAIEDALGSIRIPDIIVRGRFEMDAPPVTPDPPMLRGLTAGARASSMATSSIRGGDTVVKLFVEGQQMAEATVPYIPGALRRLGV